MRLFSARYTSQNIRPDAAHPNGMVAKRALLNATVFGPNGSLRCRVQLDTGADECLFPLPFARSLGFDPNRMPESVTQGVAGPAGVRYGEVEIVIPCIGPHGVEPLQIETWAGFTAGLTIGLLGQTGFFDRHMVTFDLANNVFTVHV